MHFDQNLTEEEKRKDLLVEEGLKENIEDYIYLRNTCSEDADLLIANFDAEDSIIFQKWTLYDLVQRRIFASFDNVDSLYKTINDEDFILVVNKIMSNRRLAFTDKEAEDIYYSEKMHNCRYIVLIKEDVTLYSSDLNINGFEHPITWNAVVTEKYRSKYESAQDIQELRNAGFIIK